MSTALNVLLAARMALPFELTDEGGTVEGDTTDMDVAALIEHYTDSVEAGFTYEHGTVQLENGVAALNLPPGFKFMSKEQAAQVVVDIWGNPSAKGVLGIIFPEATGPFADTSYAYVVRYEEDGYVEDDDADDIDYDKLLEEMREGESENNALRAQDGFQPMYLVGWAAPPYYDQERKVLHWAQEIKFGDSAMVNTLNYNVRVLGRKGVLVLNAVSTMAQLELVKQHVPEVLGIVQFNDGYKYEQFDSSVDKVAAGGIGALVAGGVLSKMGFFAVVGKFLLKFWYLAVVGIGGLWKWITGRKKQGQVPPAA